MMTRNIRWTTSLFAVLACLCVGAVLPGTSAAQEQGLENLRQTGQAFRAVAKKVSPAVVFIQVEKELGGGDADELRFPFDEDFLRRFFGEAPQFRFRSPGNQAEKRRQVGQGSGFIISADGYILTNNHVVGDADKVRVKLLDGREYTAQIVGTDPPTDLAVIKIDEHDLPYLQLGDSNRLEEGDWVLAVGNPFGLSHTLTAGIVSAKGRSGIGINDYEDFIQTDAAINPGNSGGPLVDLDGRAVGINTAIFSRSGGYMGIGFAIPINMAKRIREQLVEHGQVTRGRIGAYIQELTPDLAEAFHLDKNEGIVVARVMEDSPAQRAGLKQGDVILRLDGKKVDKVGAFRNRIAFTEPGTKVRLAIVREGQHKTVDVTVGKLEADAQERPVESGELSKLGLSLQRLTPELAERLGYDGEAGVLVTDVAAGSIARLAGIERGDLILEIDRKAVTTPAQVRKLLASDQGKSHLVLLRHGEGSRYLSLKLDD